MSTATAEGIRDDCRTLPKLTFTDLAGPLACLVRRKCSDVALTVGVADRRDARKIPEMVLPLVKELGSGLNDICCFSGAQTGNTRWMAITTHGNASIEGDGDNASYRPVICEFHPTTRENQVGRSLTALRNELLVQTYGGCVREFPYPTIKGHVLLCGDFALTQPAVLLGLYEIFKRNGAARVTFVTPVIYRAYCVKVELAGAQIVRLHPPE